MHLKVTETPLVETFTESFPGFVIKSVPLGINLTASSGRSASRPALAFAVPGSDALPWKPGTGRLLVIDTTALGPRAVMLLSIPLVVESFRRKTTLPSICDFMSSPNAAAFPDK